MQVSVLSCFIILLGITLPCSAFPWTQGHLKYGKDDFIYLSPSKFWNNGLNREPNCNELRAMWRFSMAKSRTTEMTNEIPTYRDPFAYNVWEPHMRSKHLESGSRHALGSQSSLSHVYGKIIHSIPFGKYSDKFKVNGRSFDDMAKLDTSDKTITPRRKNAEAYRLPNGAVSIRKLPALTDSFRRLKAVVRAQRAKEFHNQNFNKKTFPHSPLNNKEANFHGYPSFDYLYYGNTSFSAKRNPAYKSLYFISHPSPFVYGPSKYYDPFLGEHNGDYYRRPHVVPANVKFGISPVSMPSHY